MLIQSRHNSQFKDLKSLLEPKGAKKLGRILVSGRKLVPECLERADLVICEDGFWPDDLPQRTRILYLERTLFKEIDVSGTHYPICVLPTPEIRSFEVAPPSGLELILSLQDPANLGAMLRSADAFGVSKVILLRTCAFPFHPKAIRASSGSCLRVPLFECASAPECVTPGTFALDSHGESMLKLDWPRDARILVGEEGQGLPPDLSVRKVAVPMAPGIDSLNAVVAASIALFSHRASQRS